MENKLDLTKPIRTKSGLKAEIVYRKYSEDYPLLVIITHKDGYKISNCYTLTGKLHENRESEYDLVNYKAEEIAIISFKKSELENPHISKRKS